MHVTVPAISMDPSVWSQTTVPALGERVAVDWPSLLSSRDRDGLNTWLATRKAESDRRSGEREERQEREAKEVNPWLASAREEVLGDRLPLPLTETLAPPLQEEVKEEEEEEEGPGLLDELKVGLLAAWAGQERGGELPEGREVDPVQPVESWLTNDVLASVWKPTEATMDSMEEETKSDLADDLRRSLLNAWGGHGVMETLVFQKEESDVTDDKEKENGKEISVVDDLKMFLQNMMAHDEEDQPWITVDEDDASIVTLDDIEDIDEMNQWLCKLV